MFLTAVLNLPPRAAAPRATATGDTERWHDLCGLGRQAQTATPKLGLGLQLQGLRELSGDRRRRKGRGCH